MLRRTEFLLVAGVAIVAASGLTGAVLLQEHRQPAAAARIIPTPAATQTPVPTPDPTPTPVPDLPTPKPAPYENVIFVSSQDGRAEVRTVQGSTCRLAGTLLDGRPYTAPGMEKVVVADRFGAARWNYTTNLTSGGGTHTVTCTVSGLTATATSSFVGGS